MGVEPTQDLLFSPTLVLKTRQPTGTEAPPLAIMGKVGGDVNCWSVRLVAGGWRLEEMPVRLATLLRPAGFEGQAGDGNEDGNGNGNGERL